ncbi:MAG: hypothetical protein H6600_05515 [Flavobacteriales bacterium]|nr:hypothetical protein [Flavobacteriales bacterium]
MREIGGYFGLELKNSEHFHDANKCLYLNSARHALEHLLNYLSPKRLYIPAYNCHVLLEPIIRLDIDYVIYHVNDRLEAEFDFCSLEKQEYIVLTNYFGVKDQYINKQTSNYENIIVDCSQSFFYKPLESQKNNFFFYSPRKFFGVSDGGILLPSVQDNINYERDCSLEKFDHLLIRREFNASLGYKKFVKHDEKISDEPIKLMSNLTHDILRSIDYKEVVKVRKSNFQFLEKELGAMNKFDCSDQTGVAMIYPFWGNCELRKELIDHRVYSPKYWPKTVGGQFLSQLEVEIVENLVFLPIDQRYDEIDMIYIVEIVRQFIKNN